MVYSLLLATSTTLLLALASNDLAKHHHTDAIHECNTGQALAILEGVAHERLLRHEAALGHLVRLQRMGVLHLLAAGLLAHLPLELRDPARRSAAAHEPDGRVADLDLVRNVQDLNLGIELTGLNKSRVLLVLPM